MPCLLSESFPPSQSCISVRMRACSHEPPCSHLLTVIGVRPAIAGNTGPRKLTFKSSSTVLPEFHDRCVLPSTLAPSHAPPTLYTCTHWHCALALAHAPLPNSVLRRRRCNSDSNTPAYVAQVILTYQQVLKLRAAIVAGEGADSPWNGKLPPNMIPLWPPNSAPPNESTDPRRVSAQMGGFDTAASLPPENFKQLLPIFKSEDAGWNRDPCYSEYCRPPPTCRRTVGIVIY